MTEELELNPHWRRGVIDGVTMARQSLIGLRTEFQELIEEYGKERDPIMQHSAHVVEVCIDSINDLIDAAQEKI